MSTEKGIDQPFVVTSLPGYTPVLGRLVCMMRYARMTTLRAVESLTPAQLDHVLDAEANSIGALLEHIACVEEAYQHHTFGWEPTASEAARIRSGLEFTRDAKEGTRGRELEDYLERLQTVRGRTLDEFARRDDAWLEEESDWWDGHTANNYFKWFHVFEDELSHRGQIRLLRKRLPAPIP